MHTIVLMYHGVTESGGGIGNPHCISLRSFEEQMTSLAQSKHTVIQWNEIVSSPTQCDVGSRVALTFDDANTSDIHCAKVLGRLGYTALFFVPTNELGKPGRLGGAEVLELSRQGMGIGSHAHHHVHLVRLSASELEQELRRSKAILEDLIQLPVEHLSFPGGAYDARVLDAARQSGYRYFHTSDWGVNTRRQLARGVLRRIPVVAGLGIADFQGILGGNYRSRQIQFYAKEITKRALGEQAYLQIRRAFLKRTSNR